MQHFKTNHWKQKEIPILYFDIKAANTSTFVNADNPSEVLTAEEYYYLLQQY